MGKRGKNGEGHLRILPNGKYELQIPVGKKPNGKPLIKSFTASTRKEVYKRFVDYMAKKERGIADNAPELFSEIAEEWSKEHYSSIQESTGEGYQNTLRILLEAFQGCKINQMEALEIKKGLEKAAYKPPKKSSSGEIKKPEKRSKSQITKTKAMLSQIFDYAVLHKYTDKNPLPVVKLPKKLEEDAPRHTKIVVFSVEETELLMENLPTDLMGLSIRFMLGTGLRPHEMIALEPRHIAEDGSYVKVEQAVSKASKGTKIGPTKTGCSKRTVLIPESYREVAIRLRKTTNKYIFQSTKCPWQPFGLSWYRKHFANTMKSMGIEEKCTPYICRHSYATNMLEAGVKLEHIRAQMGHSDIRTTRVYLHVRPTAILKDLSKFDERFACPKLEKDNYFYIFDEDEWEEACSVPEMTYATTIITFQPAPEKPNAYTMTCETLKKSVS